MKEYEEQHELTAGWSWALIVGLTALILAWGFVNWALVKDGPREWNFGTLPDTPSQSIYSTGAEPEMTTPPKQIAPLPEARPWEKGQK